MPNINIINKFMIIYYQLLNLFKNRRTVRLASETGISDDYLNKILAAAKTAPSFDKLYPYKIYVLTNSVEGRLKKERLLEYFRCGSDRPLTGWKNKEILQPILSGLVLVYTYQYSVSRTPDPIQPATTGLGAIDAIMSATMALMAAESLELKTGFFACVKDRKTIMLELTENPEEHFVCAVTIANENLGLQYTTRVIDYPYKEDTARIFLKKHHDIKNTVKIKTI
jgi:nitroreductase